MLNIWKTGENYSMRVVMVGGGGKVANRHRETLKIPIRTLRAKGLSYNKIAEKLQCSTATINYWLDPDGKQKVLSRNQKNRRRWLVEHGSMWKYNYLYDKCCEYCGESNMLTLQFDHKDATTKSDKITNLMRGSIRALNKEAEKCRILCANCHQIKTMQENNATFYNTYVAQERKRKKHGCRE